MRVKGNFLQSNQMSTRLLKRELVQTITAQKKWFQIINFLRYLSSCLCVILLLLDQEPSDFSIHQKHLGVSVKPTHWLRRSGLGSQKFVFLSSQLMLMLLIWGHTLSCMTAWSWQFTKPRMSMSCWIYLLNPSITWRRVHLFNTNCPQVETVHGAKERIIK